jgi:hypothetical protein
MVLMPPAHNELSSPSSWAVSTDFQQLRAASPLSAEGQSADIVGRSETSGKWLIYLEQQDCMTLGQGGKESRASG